MRRRDDDRNRHHVGEEQIVAERHYHIYTDDPKVRIFQLVVLPQGICFCGLWPSFRAFVGPFVDMWGSQSQVLSTSFWRGLHFLRWQGPNPDIGRVWCGSWCAQRAIFQGFWLWASEISKFSLVRRGIWPRMGSQLSKSWKKSWVLIGPVNLGKRSSRFLHTLSSTVVT